MALLRREAKRNESLDDLLWLSEKMKIEASQPTRALVFDKLVADTENSNIMEVPYHKGPTKRTAPLREGGKRRTVHVSMSSKASLEGLAGSSSYKVSGEMTVGEFKYKIEHKQGVGAQIQQAFLDTFLLHIRPSGLTGTPSHTHNSHATPLCCSNSFISPTRTLSTNSTTTTPSKKQASATRMSCIAFRGETFDAFLARFTFSCLPGHESL